MAQQQKNGQEQDLNQLRKVRREKLAELQQNGRDPFVITKYDQTHHSREIKDNFDELEGKQVSIAGRMMSKRVMGKASFCNVQDLEGNIQSYVARDSIGEENYKEFKKLDVGDVIGDVHPCISCDSAVKEPPDPSGEVPRTDEHGYALPPEICGSHHESGGKGYIYQAFQDHQRDPQIPGRTGRYGG